MSNPIADEGEPATLEHLVQCLTNSRLALGVSVASAALIFYDWFLTSGDEFYFLWKRGRTTYARMLFIVARYSALACAIAGLLPPTIKTSNITTCLSVIIIVSAELILALRTWAIWGRSRPILAFLVCWFIVCALPAMAIVERDLDTSVVILSATWNGVEPCRVVTSNVERAWVVPYIGIMMFEFAIVSLTLYRVLQCYRVTPTKRSELLDVLWIDGVIYFFFMLLLGIFNIVLVVNVTDPQVRASCTQLQTIAHSVLSTRVMLHTGRVLRRGPANPRPPSVQHRLSTKESAGASEGSTGRRTVNEHSRMDSTNEVELERLINNVM